MTFETIYPVLSERVAHAEVLGKSIKFDYGDSFLHIDGTGEGNVTSLEDKAADCVIQMSMNDFLDLVKGKLNPMTAVMFGKIKIKGDITLAMRLKDLFGK